MQTFFNKVGAKLKITNAPDRIMARLPYKLTRPKKRHRKPTYSQSGEDIIIKLFLDSRGITQPTYIDIGAHDPFWLNNTAIFYNEGAHGINIEPDPILFEKFDQVRGNDTNLNIGVAAKAGRLKLHIVDPPTLNTFSEKEARIYEKMGHHTTSRVDIEVLTFAQVIKKYCGGRTPDILSIDVEGMDFEILESINFDKTRPLVICAETIGYTKDDSGEKDSRISKLLFKNDYEIYADTRINTIFIDRRNLKRGNR